MNTELYKKVTGKTKTKLDFTLFDREFIIHIGEEIKELRETIKGQNELIIQLETSILKMQGYKREDD